MVRNLALLAALAGGIVAAAWWWVPGASRVPGDAVLAAQADGGDTGDPLRTQSTPGVSVGSEPGIAGAESPVVFPPGRSERVAVVPMFESASMSTAPASVEAVREDEMEAQRRHVLEGQERSARPKSPEELQRLLGALRDDDVRHNADSAVWELVRSGPEVVPLLEQALSSEDGQQRQLAAFVLAHRADAPPSQPLADALVRSMGPYDPLLLSRREPGGTARLEVHAGSYIRERAQRRLEEDEGLFALAVPGLIACLSGTDEPHKLRAGRVLAHHRSWMGLDQNLESLIGHLRDNDTAADASVSMQALCEYGDMAAGALGAAWPGGDDQQRVLLGHLLARFAPAHTGARRLTPKQLSALGLIRGDPVIYTGVGWP